MTSADLRHLLDLYRFLDGAEETHGASMPMNVRGKVRSERADVFRRLLDHPSDDPAVTIAQLRALMSCLAGAQQDAGLMKAVTDTCRAHLDRLAERAEPSGPSTTLELPEIVSCCKRIDASVPARLNHMSHRIILISPDYRYVFSNEANCRFFGKEPSFFINRPMWEATGVDFFERVNRPAFGSCFNGRTATYVSPHPGHDPSILYRCTAQPVRDTSGEVVAALGVVTNLSAAPSAGTSLN